MTDTAIIEHRKIAGLRDIEAIEQTPLDEAIPFTTTAEIFARARDQFGDLPALTFLFSGSVAERPVSWTYDDLIGDITRTANALHPLADDALVGIVLPNLPETHFALWGGQLASAALPINPMLEPEHIAGILNGAKVKTVVALAPFPQTDIYQKVAEALQHAPAVKRLVLVDMVRYIPAEMRQALGLRALPPAPREDIEVIDFHAAIADQPADATCFERQITPKTIASLFHTGGTTGVPKLAVHSHLNQAFMAWMLPLTAAKDPGKTVLCGLPLFHVNAALVTGLASFVAGEHIILATPQGYRNQTLIKDFWKIIAKYRVHAFSGVPTLYAALLDVPVAEADISSLEYGVCGASPMSQALFERVERDLGIRLIEGYGMTEAACVSALNPFFGERRAGSVGLRLPYQELRIAELDDLGHILRDCATGEVGEVLLKGPNVFPGYTDAAKNRGVLLDGGWINTGDLGRLDADGYLWLAGRSKDVIIRGGHNIDPAIIEDALMAHPAVAHAAGIGQPDIYAGELPVAYVALRAEQAVTSDELMTHVATTIAERAARPVRIEVLGDLPMTAVGKVFKPDLRKISIQSALHAELEKHALSVAEITVIQDSERGLVALVSTDPAFDAGRVAEVLAGFAVPIDLVDQRPALASRAFQLQRGT